MSGNCWNNASMGAMVWFVVCLYILSIRVLCCSAVQRRTTTRIPISLSPADESLILSSEQMIKSYNFPTVNKQTVTKVLGYGMGIGAMTLYSPMILSIMTKQNVNGFVVQTWAMNLIGVSLAMHYPYRNKFPVSAYVELIAIAVQCSFILGLIGFYRGQLPQITGGLVLHSAAMISLLRTKKMTPQLMRIIQLLSVVVCNSSNIPQIVLSFRTKRTSWNAITALFSITGCAVRVFTTMSVSSDPLAVAGYLTGLVTNSVLLAQVLMYSPRAPITR